jgi:hypothetical protein
MRRRRRRTILLILVGILLFLVISALLTRALAVGGAEDTAITNLVKAEASGSAPRVMASIKDCQRSPSCRARAAGNAAALNRRGTVSIIQIQSSAGFSLGQTEGTARVAWLAGSSLPIVQCVRVRRAGNVFQGFTIELLEVSRRIKSDAACPSRY